MTALSRPPSPASRLPLSLLPSSLSLLPLLLLLILTAMANTNTVDGSDASMRRSHAPPASFIGGRLGSSISCGGSGVTNALFSSMEAVPPLIGKNNRHCYYYLWKKQRQQQKLQLQQLQLQLSSQRLNEEEGSRIIIHDGNDDNLGTHSHNTQLEQQQQPQPQLQQQQQQLQTLFSLDANHLPEWIIQWRGEGTEGYSTTLRHWEFTSAFRAELADYIGGGDRGNDDGGTTTTTTTTAIQKYYAGNLEFHFQDALMYQGPISYPADGNDAASAPDVDYDDASNDANNTNLNKVGGKENQEGVLLVVEPIPLSQAQAYESAMQYVTVSLPSLSSPPPSTTASSASPSSSSSPPGLLFHDAHSVENLLHNQEALATIFKNTIQRCSLIRTAYQIVAQGDSPTQLADAALDNDSFSDLMEGGIHENATWSLRLRRYGSSSPTDARTTAITATTAATTARYGKNARSPLTDERKAIFSMAHLVTLFRGKVNLAAPECKIYLLEGLKHRHRHCVDVRNDIIENTDDGHSSSKMLLARVIAQGPKTSIYAPKTRICITTTPLCALASFTLCNVAQLQRSSNPAVLDPFAGSCATLLAAAHITSMPSASTSGSLSSSSLSNNDMPTATNSGTNNKGGCRSIGIEFLHNGYVNRDNIIKDFETRNLEPPMKIIRGDCLSPEVRDLARNTVGGGGGFDAIITDPPYGIRESMSGSTTSSSSSSDSSVPNGEGELMEALPPLTQLFYVMGEDRANGTPLLKRGGRLVAFVPVRKGETLEECLPAAEAVEGAGLKMEGEGKEQVLSDILSRWLVSFVCE